MDQETVAKIERYRHYVEDALLSASHALSENHRLALLDLAQTLQQIAARYEARRAKAA